MRLFRNKAAIFIVIPLIAAINWLASRYHTAIDFTAEKRFTLSASTKKMLRNLEAPVEIDVLLAGDIRSEFKKLAGSTAELLQNFKNYGGNKIRFRFEIPGEGLTDSAKALVYDSLVNMGLRPTNQQVQVKEGEGKNQRQIFPGAVLSYGDRQVAVDLLQGQVQKNVFSSDNLLDKQSLNSAEALLEYKFAHAIQQLTQKETPVVAYAYGNGEPPYGFPPVNSLFETLGRNFIVDTFDLQHRAFVDTSYAAVVIVKPSVPFSDDDKFKLDQYVMNGGRLFFLVDMLYAERDSLEQSELTAYARDLQLNDLLFRYGVRIKTDLLADKHCDMIPVEVGSVGGNPQRQLLPWPYAPLLQPGSDHPIVKNQADVLAQFANPVELVNEGVGDIRKTVLLSSSSNANVLPTPARVTLNDLQTEEDISRFNKKNIPVAVLLEGNFSSLYANRASQAQLELLKSTGMPFQKNSVLPGKVIVAGDADLVINQISEQIGPMPMGANKYTKLQYANKDFFLNCVEYLANPNNILEARAKDYTLRLLDQEKVARQGNLWRWINLVMPVVLVLLFASVFQWLRRKKYTR
jgi:gliding-associated putative ABC transporter substrate-binding component GldG